MPATSRTMASSEPLNIAVTPLWLGTSIGRRDRTRRAMIRTASGSATDISLRQLFRAGKDPRQAVAASTRCQTPSSKRSPSSSASRFCSSCSRARRAEHHRRHARVAQAPGDRQRRRRDAQFLRQRAEPARALDPARRRIAEHAALAATRSPAAPSRESAGTPSLYLPVSRPEASGDQIVVPMPNSAYSGAYSSFDPLAVQQVVLRLLHRRRMQVAQRARSCAPRGSAAPTIPTCPSTAPCPGGSASSIAHTVSSIGVSGSGRWQKYRSR